MGPYQDESLESEESYHRSSILWSTLATGRCSLARSIRRELFTGLIRIHVLIHASHEPIFGLGMMEELGHHGYRIGPGTLYPLLHGMERAKLLKSELKNIGGRRRRVYKITASGRTALNQATEKVDELHEEHPRRLPKLQDGHA
jgi:PadR family transcriptional regulator, regulatory protein PadR